MIAVDTNVLVHAHRAGLPGHERALAWLRHLAEGKEPWGIPVFCLGEFVRVTTHPRVLDPPSTLEEALAALEGLLESPTVRVLGPGPSYPELFAEAVRAGDARGNLAFDAQIHAVCREQGASRLLTLDRDFARFPG
ncbi:MAG: TA system VapC family ribonuclease toxin, partial [Gemmatimonadota bacterium]